MSESAAFGSRFLHFDTTSEGNVQMSYVRWASWLGFDACFSMRIVFSELDPWPVQLNIAGRGLVVALQVSGTEGILALPVWS